MNINDLLKMPGKDYPQEDQYQFLLYMLPILMNARVIVETGLGPGITTRIFLSALSLSGHDTELHTYELYPEREAPKEAIPLICSLNFKAKWWLHTNVDSVYGAQTWSFANQNVDILYLDSDHAYQHVLNELKEWYINLNEKCVVIVEDTYPRPWNTFTEQQRKEIVSTYNNGELPADPYWAMHNFFKDKPEWNLIDFTIPEGKTLALRGF